MGGSERGGAFARIEDSTGGEVDMRSACQVEPAIDLSTKWSCLWAFFVPTACWDPQEDFLQVDG